MKPMLELKDEKKLNDIQMQWFDTKTTEELYDCEKDPYNLENLAGNPLYKDELIKMRRAFEKHQKKYKDLAETPEATLVAKMWPNNTQPITLMPNVKVKRGKVRLSSGTKGASIAYKIADNPNEKFDYNDHWKLYSKPISVAKGMYVYAIAERIGFKESEIKINKI